MSKNVITVDDQYTVEKCYEIMIENDFEQIPVTSKENGHLKGIIKKNDILKLLMDDIEYSQQTVTKKLSDINIDKVITTDPISDIRRVAKVMLDFNLNAIPVVNDNDVLVGIVTKNDILKAVSNIPHLQIWA